MSFIVSNSVIFGAKLTRKEKRWTMKNQFFVKQLNAEEFFVAQDGSLLNELFHPDKIGLRLPFSIAYGKLEPRGSTKPHSLSQPEIYLFISGEGIFKTNNQRSYPVKALSLVYVPPGYIQWIENTSESPLCFFCIVSPPWKAEWEKEESV
jgi:cytosine deaminase